MILSYGPLHVSPTGPAMAFTKASRLAGSRRSEGYVTKARLRLPCARRGKSTMVGKLLRPNSVCAKARSGPSARKEATCQDSTQQAAQSAASGGALREAASTRGGPRAVRPAAAAEAPRSRAARLTHPHVGAPQLLAQLDVALLHCLHQPHTVKPSKASHTSKFRPRPPPSPAQRRT